MTKKRGKIAEKFRTFRKKYGFEVISAFVTALFKLEKIFYTCKKITTYVIIKKNPMGIGFGAVAGLRNPVQIYVTIY